MADSRYVEVALPLPLDGPLTYAVPETMPMPRPGCRVVVPVGRRRMIGVLAGAASRDDSGDYRIRHVLRCLDESPLLSPFLLRFLSWVSEYYYYPIGQVMSEALPPGFLTARATGISRISRTASARGRSRFSMDSWDGDAEFRLTAQQRLVFSSLDAMLKRGDYSPVLLHGVTGSGKTEIYLRAAASCIAAGRKVLVMVPEIAMTAQTMGWFSSRFGDMLSVLHSGMTQAQRRDQWWRIRLGESPIVVGTRSAIFAPLDNTGLVIVDEEHDSSYKQSEKLRYNARDMAMVLGSLAGATVLLGSATPSLASYANVLSGKYQLLELKERVAGRKLPSVSVVDRRAERKGRGRRRISGRGKWLTPELDAGVRETLGRGEQVMLFLNRRGFATYIFCPECGYVFRCANCDVTLTWHRTVAAGSTGSGARENSTGGFLKCHYCGHEVPGLPLCPSCGGQSVKALGYGTEKVEREVREYFPGVRTARIDRDTVSSTRRLREIISGFRAGEIDLVVGTQMITKGHDFPGLTLVGVLWADMGLNVPEFNAAEKTFQLITQVAGRAGRGDRPGRVILQTWMPEHYAVKSACAQDYKTFYRMEAAARNNLSYAPFSRMVNFRLSGRDREKVARAGEDLAALAGKICADILSDDPQRQVDILGPAPSPRARIKNRYRSQLLLKSRSFTDIRSVCRAIIREYQRVIPAAVRLEIDVDPESML